MIDAIKYRISKLTATIKQQYTPSEDRKEYICLRCGAEWTELDVLSLYNEEGFECQQCGAILERTEDVKGTEGIDRTGHEKNSKLMAQLDHFLKLLKQIDATEIPPNDFETAWDHKIDVVRNPETHPTRPTVAAPPARPGQAVSAAAAPTTGAAGARPTPSTVRGTTKTDANAIEISLTSNEEKSAAEQAAESARKAARERQNALPIWHTQSTVSTTAQPISSSNQPTLEPKVEEAEEQKPVLGREEDEDSKERTKADLDALDDIAAYYAEIARSKAEEASEEEEDDDEDEDEEEEDEFEDVGGIGDAPPAAAAAAATTTTITTTTTTTAGIKRELDDAEAEAKAEAAPSPQPAAKKVKTEDPDPGETTTATPKAKVKAEEQDVVSDEDDEEFEDV